MSALGSSGPMQTPQPENESGPPVLYRTCAWLAAVIVAALFAAGVMHALREDGQLPSLQVSTNPGVKALLVDGQLDEALRQLRIEAQLQPQPASLRVLREVAETRGDTASEILALEKLAGISPRRSAPKIALANRIVEVQLAERDTSPAALAPARTHLERALTVDPRSSQAYEGLARIDFLQGNRAAAIEGLRRALALAPDSDHLKQTLKQLGASPEPAP